MIFSSDNPKKFSKYQISMFVVWHNQKNCCWETPKQVNQRFNSNFFIHIACTLNCKTPSNRLFTQPWKHPQDNCSDTSTIASIRNSTSAKYICITFFTYIYSRRWRHWNCSGLNWNDLNGGGLLKTCDNS